MDYRERLHFFLPPDVKDEAVLYASRFNASLFLDREV